MDHFDIFRTFHPNAEYTYFSSAYGTFSRIDHILGHKSKLSKFKKIEIISCIYSNNNATMRLDISYKKKILTNTWRLNHMLLNNQQITEELKMEIKKILESNDNENMTAQNLWNAVKSVLRRKFIAIQSYLKKQEKQYRQPNFTPKTTGKRTTTKIKISRRKEITKIRAEINEKEMKETIVKINKTKSCFF